MRCIGMVDMKTMEKKEEAERKTNGE